MRVCVFVSKLDEGALPGAVALIQVSEAGCLSPLANVVYFAKQHGAVGVVFINPTERLVTLEPNGDDTGCVYMYCWATWQQRHIFILCFQLEQARDTHSFI